MIARPPPDVRPFLLCPRCFERVESKLHAAGKEIVANVTSQQEVEVFKSTGKTMSEVLIAASGKVPKLIK